MDSALLLSTQIFNYVTAAYFAAMVAFLIYLPTRSKGTALVATVLTYIGFIGDAAAIGKSLGDDLAEGKPTLPLIHAMRTGTAQQSALVRSAIVDGGRDRFPGVLDAIRASGALGYARGVAQREAGLAQEAIESLPRSK